MQPRSLAREAVPTVSTLNAALLAVAAAARIAVGGRLLAASGAFLLATPALAQTPLPPILSVATVDLRNAGGPLEHVEGAEPATAELSYASPNPLFDAQLVGRAETFGGSMPAATAELEVSARKVEEFGSGQFRGAASSALYYWMQVRERRAPPIAFLPQLRVHARVVGEASVSGSGGGATASAIARIGLRSATAQVRTDGVTSDGFDESFVFVVLPEQQVPISITAGVSAGVTVVPDFPEGFASGRAFAADPVLRFDEEEFAEYLVERGVEPFLQADYYELELSEPITVSEPGAVASLLSAVAAIRVARGRRASVR